MRYSRYYGKTFTGQNTSSKSQLSFPWEDCVKCSRLCGRGQLPSRKMYKDGIHLTRGLAEVRVDAAVTSLLAGIVARFLWTVVKPPFRGPREEPLDVWEIGRAGLGEKAWKAGKRVEAVERTAEYRGGVTAAGRCTRTEFT